MTPSPDTQSTDTDFRRRVRRSTTACLQCRSRKRKCGAAPQTTCQNCRQDALACEWPMIDGRKTRLHRPKRRKTDEEVPREHKQARGGAAEHSPPPDIVQLNGFDTLSTDAFPFLEPYMLDSLNASQSVEDVPLSRLENFLPTWSSHIDPTALLSALSSQIPIFEDLTPTGQMGLIGEPKGTVGGAPGHGSEMETAGPSRNAAGRGRRDSEVHRIVWWRPHGDTALAPGLKKIILKVRVENPRAAPRPPHPGLSEQPADIIQPNGMPSPAIMDHLLDLFDIHFACQFPALRVDELRAEAMRGGGSIFLLNCIACSAARFSSHPWIALPHLQPHEYGNVFLKVAQDMMGSMLSVPSRDTVNALALLAGISHGNDNESAEWMTTGMAVRMAVDMGLHLDGGEDSQIPAEERRLNRLTFWTVLILDSSLSFGVGRETTFNIKAIRQSLPTEDDMPENLEHGCRSAFPFAAAQMLSYGSYINALNGPHDSDSADGEWLDDARLCIKRSIALYNSLPADMQWNASNFQLHSASKQGSIFLQMHLWLHTLIASAYLTNTSQRGPVQTSSWSGDAPMDSADTEPWRHAARVIGDILVLSDIIDPFSYHSLPFVNQAFFVAGCCYIKDVERQQQKVMSHSGTSSRQEPEDARQAHGDELFHDLLTVVTSRNISTLQRGLRKQSVYWSGVSWVAEALDQRLSGVSSRAIDLAKVTEQLTSYVSIKDAGLVPRAEAAHERDWGLSAYTHGGDWLGRA